ncbi:MAG TPA: winged helix-turn-helix domain-containing protein [Candidatus Acidoferrales bacterium]|nr:winged helix-turn-helix domain-containing protein [Candidatus Acidoferrales bacterium]
MESSAFLAYAAESNFPVVRAAGVTLYPQSHEVFIGAHNVRCNRTQFRVLSALLGEFCRTVPYAQLMSTQSTTLAPNEQNLLKVEICHLRRLLRRHRAGIEIRNIYGQGYQARPASEPNLFLGCG